MSGLISHDGLRTRAAKLAGAAAALKRASGAANTPFSLAFLTDRRRITRPDPILRGLPAGSAVIYRDYDDPARTAVARRLAAICRSRGLIFLVAGDRDLAAAAGADGVHWPARLVPVVRDKTCGIVTTACHDAAQLARAAAIGADLALLSPAFATPSHPNTEHLGAARFKALAGGASLPVLALGGVDATNARRLAGPGVAGLAAIGAFASGDLRA